MILRAILAGVVIAVAANGGLPQARAEAPAVATTPTQEKSVKQDKAKARVAKRKEIAEQRQEKRKELAEKRKDRREKIKTAVAKRKEKREEHATKRKERTEKRKARTAKRKETLTKAKEKRIAKRSADTHRPKAEPAGAPLPPPSDAREELEISPESEN